MESIEQASQHTSAVRRGLAAAIAVVAVLGSGCGASAGGSSDGDGAADDQKAQTTYSTKAPTGAIDGFTWGLPYGEPQSLDPIKSYGDSENTVLANVCESLQRENPDLSISDGLATFKQQSPTTLVYTVRPGVTFSDGKPLTADDIVYSLERNRDEQLASYWAAPFYNNVRSIEKSSDTEVTVRLSRPDAVFNRMMATAAGAIGERDYIERQGKSYGTPKGGLMCTGPYALDSWQSGSRITLKANDRYWDEKLQPKASQITFSFVTDESTLASALTSGQIDGTYDVPAAAVSQLRETADGGTLTFGAGTSFFAFRPTQRKGPLADVRIRQALSLALDRKAIARVIFQGTAVPSVTPASPGAWSYARKTFQEGYDRLPKPTFDLDQAERLVGQAGNPTATIRIALPADQRVYADTAQALQSNAQRIGLKVKLASLPTNEFNNLYYDPKARRDYDAMAVQEYGAGVAEPIVSLSEFTPLSDYNYGDLRDPAVTDNISLASRTYDDDKRAEAVVAAQAALVKTEGSITVANVLNAVYQGGKITGAPASISFLYYPWAARVGARGG